MKRIQKVGRVQFDHRLSDDTKQEPIDSQIDRPIKQSHHQVDETEHQIELAAQPKQIYYVEQLNAINWAQLNGAQYNFTQPHDQLKTDDQMD